MRTAFRGEAVFSNVKHYTRKPLLCQDMAGDSTHKTQHKKVRCTGAQRTWRVIMRIKENYFTAGAVSTGKTPNS